MVREYEEAQPGPANAVPALKERATGIIDSNDADGVAKYWSQQWDGTRK